MGALVETNDSVASLQHGSVKSVNATASHLMNLTPNPYLTVGAIGFDTLLVRIIHCGPCLAIRRKVSFSSTTAPLVLHDDNSVRRRNGTVTVEVSQNTLPTPIRCLIEAVLDDGRVGSVNAPVASRVACHGRG